MLHGGRLEANPQYPRGLPVSSPRCTFRPHDSFECNAEFVPFDALDPFYPSPTPRLVTTNLFSVSTSYSPPPHSGESVWTSEQAFFHRKKGLGGVSLSRRGSGLGVVALQELTLPLLKSQRTQGPGPRARGIFWATATKQKTKNENRSN